jgi:hypothetical protein
MTPQDPQSRSAHRRLQLVVWLAMVMAGVMYFVVIKLVPPSAPLPNPSLETTLLAIAAGFVGVSFPLENRIRGPREETRNLARGRAAQIAGLVLCESAAVLGVVVNIVTGSPRGQLIIAIGVAGLLLHYPKREDSIVDRSSLQQSAAQRRIRTGFLLGNLRTVCASELSLYVSQRRPSCKDEQVLQLRS